MLLIADDNAFFNGTGILKQLNSCNCRNGVALCNEVLTVHLMADVYIFGIHGYANNFGEYSIRIFNCPDPATLSPSMMPTNIPTTNNPTTEPTIEPTVSPTIYPSTTPTLSPTALPTVLPSTQPSLVATVPIRTEAPSVSPSNIDDFETPRTTIIHKVLVIHPKKTIYILSIIILILILIILCIVYCHLRKNKKRIGSEKVLDQEEHNDDNEINNNKNNNINNEHESSNLVIMEGVNNIPMQVMHAMNSEYYKTNSITIFDNNTRKQNSNYFPETRDFDSKNYISPSSHTVPEPPLPPNKHV